MQNSGLLSVVDDESVGTPIARLLSLWINFFLDKFRVYLYLLVPNIRPAVAALMYSLHGSHTVNASNPTEALSWYGRVMYYYQWYWCCKIHNRNGRICSPFST